MEIEQETSDPVVLLQFYVAKCQKNFNNSHVRQAIKTYANKNIEDMKRKEDMALQDGT